MENILWTFIPILASLSYLFYTKFIKTDPHQERCLQNFRYIPTNPFFGNVLDIIFAPSEEILGIVRKYVKECGLIFKYKWFNNYTVNCIDPIILEKLLSSSVQLEKGRDYELLVPWLGNGLLISNGHKHHSRRKLLTPSFNFAILENFLEIFNLESIKFVEILSKKYADTNQIFNIFPYISRCTLDIICETAMGKSINAQLESNSDYLKAVNGMCGLLIQRIFNPLLKPELIWRLSSQGREEKRYLKVLHEFTKKVIQERKIERKQLKIDKEIENKENSESIYGKNKRKAFLDLLIDYSDDGKVLSDEDICEETDTFMFEGHDTTAASLNWTIYLLGLHKYCQRKVQEEIRQVIGDDISLPITTKELGQLKYLEACIKESLRLYPSVPFLSRKTTEDIDIGNLIIPKGLDISICIYMVHRNPDYFPDPESFNPDRFFLQENNNNNFIKRNPYSYIPFSAGVRNCIGQKFAMMEEKIILAHFFRKFSVHSVEKEDEIKICPDLILRPKNGINIILTNI